MSSYYAAYNVFGLLLNEQETEVLKKGYMKKNAEWLKSQCDDDDVEEVVDEWFSCNELLYRDEEKEDAGLEIITIDNDFFDGVVFYPISFCHTKAPFRAEDKRGERCTVIVADLQPSAIQQLGNLPFYSSVEEVVEEFREKCKDLLPDGFDYTSHIGELSYAAYA